MLERENIKKDNIGVLKMKQVLRSSGFLEDEIQEKFKTEVPLFIKPLLYIFDSQ